MKLAVEKMGGKQAWLTGWIRVGIVSSLGLGAMAFAAPDLQVADFLYVTPQLNGANANFQIAAKNNGDTAAENVRLRVFLPAIFTFNTLPPGCSLSNPSYTFSVPNNPNPGVTYSSLKLLSCSYASVAAGSTVNLSFNGVASGTGVADMLADIYSDTDESGQGTNGDNALPKQITVNSGADLALQMTPIVVTQGASTLANGAHVLNGSTVSIAVKTRNQGPNPASSAQAVITLPSTSNFSSVTLPGVPWTCSNVSNTVTCTYSGPAIAANTNFPDITIGGKFTASTVGNVSISASISSPVNSDPDASNNGVASTSLTLDPGIDLTANKSLRWNSVAVTNVAFGNQAYFRIGIHNAGPMTLPTGGALVSDVIDSRWSIGAMPTGCTLSGRTVTCVNRTAVANGGDANFDIPVTAPGDGSGGTTGSNTATVSLLGVSGMTETSTDNNTSTVNYTWVGGTADLTLSKIKTVASQPLTDGDSITNTITVSVTGASTSIATGTITVTDTLTNFPMERYSGASGTGWACTIPNPGIPSDPTNRVITCLHTDPGGGYPPGASLPVLTITTQANLSGMANGGYQVLSNTACTGKTTGYSLENNTANDCQTRSVTSSKSYADVTVTKAAATAGGGVTTLENNEMAVTYTLTVTNNNAPGGDTVPFLTVTDDMPLYKAFPSIGTTGVTAVITGALFGESCALNNSNGAVTCTLKNLAPGQTRTITVTATRPMLSGSHTNTATVTSTSAFLSGTRSATATVVVDPRTNVGVAKQANPTSARVGQPVLFTLTVNAYGPDNALALEVFDAFDSSRFTLDPSYNITIDNVAAGGSCSQQSVTAAWSGNSTVDALNGTSGLYCNLGNVAVTPGVTKVKTIKYQAIPKFPYPDSLTATYANKVYVKTSTYEDSADLANNYASVNVTVNPPSLDLTVSEDDTGFDPTTWGANSPDIITYHVLATNSATSQTKATAVNVVNVPTPPAGYTMTLQSGVINGNGNYTPTNFSCRQPGGGNGKVICSFDDLPTGKSVGINVTYVLAGVTPAGALVFENDVKICSNEAGPSNNLDPDCPTATANNYDSSPANNAVIEKTTALPRTDLEVVSKTASKTNPDLNEIFNYTVILRNRGPADASLVTFTDALPTGMRTAGAVAVTVGSSVALTTNSCGGSAGLSNISCNMGPIPADPSANDSSKLVTLTIPVKIDASLSPAPQPGNYNNTACLVPADDLNDFHTPKLKVSQDPNSGNNCSSGGVNVPVKATLGGKVYFSSVLAPGVTIQSGGIASVTLTLTGTAGTGNGLVRTTTTDANGTYLFDYLPPGTYNLSETQPANYYDGRTFTGTVINGTAGSVGKSGYVSASAADTVTGIILNDNGIGASFNFEEYKPVTISGYVYIDANNDGLKSGVAETGLAGAVLSIRGTDYTGTILSTANQTTSGSGTYTFVVPPTNNVAGYTLTELVEPPNTFDGKDYDGSGVVSASAGRTAGTDAFNLAAATLVPGATLSNRNFGELLAATLAGYSYIDLNENAVKESGEPVLNGVTITLSGTDYLGNAVLPTTLTTNTSINGGEYQFTNLKPGTYKVSEASLPVLSNTGAQAGTPANGTATVANTTPQEVSGVVIGAGATLTNYNFGHKGTLLSGFVYIDTNRNGIKDPGEPGIQNVRVTLSGTAWNNQDVCTLLAAGACTQSTGADGSYSFSSLPASNPAGYTLKERDANNNPSDVLAYYGDGAEMVGSLGGSAVVNDQISGIVISANQAGGNYNFGELGGRLAGTVYFDSNNDGAKAGDGSEAGIASVKVTLAGNTPSVGALAGGAVCSFMGMACTGGNLEAITDASGNFVIENLPAADSAGFTLTENHPIAWLDGKETIGTLGGAAANSGFDTTAANNRITSIPLTAGGQGTGYLFGERSSVISGYVYIDADNNGVKAGSEPGIPGVTVTLSGKDVNNADVNRTATTNSLGYFVFAQVPASDATGYILTETPPAGFLDGKEKAGTINGITVGTVDNTAFNNNPDKNQISAIILPPGQSGNNYLFGERGGSLSGYVYADTNNDGAKAATEPGLPNIPVTLSGRTDDNLNVCTLIAACTVNTDASGKFVFDGIPPGNYTLTENQQEVDRIADSSGASKYTDGKETVGVAGGIIGGLNQYFGSQAEYNRISGIQVTSANIAANGGILGGYLFGERPRAANNLALVPPIVSGHVWMDRKHNRIRPADGTMEGQAGWTVVLSRNGTGICTVSTDANGFYQFDNLHCPGYESGLPTGTGFSISFSKDSNRLPNITSSGGGAGTTGVGQISALTLSAGDEVTEQNLPLDPSGIVYDAVSRKPVAGATITISGPVGFDPTTHLVGGSSTQNTGTDGLYAFFLQNAFPSGTYTLGVTAPAGYLPAPSVMIPSCTGILAVEANPTPALIQGSNTQPSSGTTLHNPTICPLSSSGFTAVAPFATAQLTTQYYFRFNITNGTSAPILNNHIPVDPVLPGAALLMTKTTPLVNVKRGELVPYTITATNIAGGALASVDVTDQTPPGFRYRLGSATLNGVRGEPTQAGRVLIWKNQSFAAGEKKTWKMMLTVGSGVGEGQYVNEVWGVNSLAGIRVSNVASATVRIVPDPTFDCSDIIGKVFDDKNANGYQDDGEPGLPNVRVATVRGLLVTTDPEGRFHVTCADIPQQDHGSNFVMKLDERTLPSGYRLTTENPRDVRLTRGKMVKLNFGATVHRVVRVDLARAAFEADSNELLPEWQQQLESLPARLAERPSILRLHYGAVGAADEAQGHRRLKALARQMKDLWQARSLSSDSTGELPTRYPLIIETESGVAK